MKKIEKRQAGKWYFVQPEASRKCGVALCGV